MRAHIGGTSIVAAVLAASVAAILAVGAPAERASATTLPGGFAEDVVAAGLTFPTGIAELPDGRILVTEKAGLIKVIKDGQLLPTPFADLSASVNNFWDRGLTGIAVDPNFGTNHHIYLFYPYDSTGNDGSGPVVNRLVRITATGDVMQAGSETVLLGTSTSPCPATPSSTCMPQEWYGHGADSIRFASDGTMFVSLGDAASWDFVDDRALRAQNIDQYPGKILRITTSGAGVPSNPFWNGDPSAIRSKVWAYGLRNPFRMALRPGTNIPYVGDVGWDAFEEIDVATAGANLGWPCYEGTARQPGYESKPVCQSLYGQGASAVKNPFISSPHTGSAAIVGGPFTPATSSFPPAYQNGFFYADYGQNWIRFAKVDANGDLVGSPSGFATGAGGPVDLAFGADGNLYYVAINVGEVRRIRGTGTPPGPVTFLSDLSPSAVPLNGWGPVELDQSNGEAGDGDGGTLTINGATYAKGLGTHAAADIRYSIPEDCTLSAQVGIDDEVPQGSVVFEVWDGTTTRLYRSPVKRAVDAATAVSVPLGAVTNLRLVVDDADDGVGYDHADWGDAKIVCGSGGGEDTTDPVLSSVTSTPSATGATVTWVTDEPADSQVEYGTTTAYGSSTPLDASKVTSHSQILSGLAPDTTYHYRVRSADAAGNAATSADHTFATLATSGETTTFLSDLSPSAVPLNGWGPVELDQSNGEAGDGDGGTLTINGATYAKGLGTHAAADIRYSIPADCTLSAQVGIDDEVPQGSVVFEVWDGTTTRLYRSPVKRAVDAATAVSVPLGAVTNLRLVVDDADDGVGYDHADWGVAKIVCSTASSDDPVPTISSPTASDTFKVGDVVQLSGSGTDSAGEPIPDSGLSWQVVLHHCPGGDCHQHPFATFTGPTASFNAPDHGDDSHLEIRLTATDSDGRSGTATTHMQPQTVTLTLEATPSGLQVIYGSSVLTTPASVEAIVGGTRTIEAPSPQGGFTWQSWSDGGTQQHTIAVPATDATIVATFDGSGQITTHLSDLSPSAPPVNGWGPVETDQSNGEAGAGDGGTLTLNGVTYAKGLGTHAAADIRYTVPSNCTLLAQVGIDDEVSSTVATVAFEVWDGTTTRLYRSPVKRAVDAATAVSVPLGGVTNLRLVVDDAGDGIGYDHADWGDAKIVCAPPG